VDRNDVVVKEIYIDATPEEVFPYLTDPSQYVKWMGLAAQFDLRPGGVHRIDVNGVDAIVGEYLEVDPPRRLKYTWSLVAQDQSAPQDASTVEIELIPRGAGTLLRLTHTGPDRAGRERHAMGWDHYLGRLDRVLKGEDPGRDPFANLTHRCMPESFSMTQNHPVVSHDQWLKARQTLLEREKEFNRQRDELSAARRALPWEEVTKNYIFDGPKGKQTLAELFDGRSQLIVYHFMFAPDWEAGCKSCSFWADNFNGIPVHLKHRDVNFVAISRAPYSKIQAYAQRMGWSFPWYSSHGNAFNFDLHVSFTPEEQAAGEAYYNYERRKIPTSDLVGISVFYQDERGKVFHTYSAYARGVDMMNGAYHYLDLTPKGRDEANQSHPQAWVRRHDEYDT